MEIPKIKEATESVRVDANIDMVICHRNRYFGIDFFRREIKEISFGEAFGLNFFDWDNMICIASKTNRRRYTEMRGKDGLGFGKVFQLIQNSEVKNG